VRAPSGKFCQYAFVKIRLIPVLAVALPVFVFSSPNDPVATLESAEWFALGGIGVAGTTSKEEIALRAVLREKEAASQFKTLLAKGNLAGQVYALLGLRLLHDAAYEKNIGRYKENHAIVRTVSGCSIMNQPVASVAASMDKGMLDVALQNPAH
jgi:hypothetical protein